MRITKKLIKSYVRDKLENDQRWSLHALEKIYAYQTDAEQAGQFTAVSNNVGFGHFDANILTSFAKQYQNRGFLSPKQINVLQRRIKKYWRQVIEMSDIQKLFLCMYEDGLVSQKDIDTFYEKQEQKEFLASL